MMTKDELRMRILANQHITCKADKFTVVRDLCGIQAQFTVHAYHALKIRCNDELIPDTWGEGLVKNWTIRGTVHVFDENDLPLFLHDGRTNYLRPQDTMESDHCISSERKKMFADYIVKLIGEGICEREALKDECFKIGMTEQECKNLFDPWGGIIRALAEQGLICNKVQEKKAFKLCPPFAPMDREKAMLEIARRYFTGFAPATIKDAAYFLGTTQARVKTWLNQLPVNSITVDGNTYFFIDNGRTDFPEIPGCVLLSGFDQLMLGYHKQQNLFLPPEHVRGIFNLAGIVFPAILLHGKVVGRWKKDRSKLTFMLFEGITGDDKKEILSTAEMLWNDIKRISWE